MIAAAVTAGDRLTVHRPRVGLPARKHAVLRWMGRVENPPLSSAANHHHGAPEAGIHIVSGHPVLVHHDGGQEIRIAAKGSGRFRGISVSAELPECGREEAVMSTCCAHARRLPEQGS
ncbi:hypothetical protein GKJPGBOP_03933 [Streptomyces paromomycinus]|uniref:Uncharacterized protein n=1 Tax=Streptomyces paromomycinus TaxID=92743 RepID=A0A401W4M1_STREY|nr:hypothetical protein GKJPGBOP_03933 [Streptomyces paromomycinus]